MPFAATQMDLEIIIVSDVSQTKQISYDIIDMWNLKKKLQMNVVYKMEIDTPRQKSNLWLLKGKGGMHKLGVLN